MARVRTPYWLPSSARNWLICNILGAGIFETGFFLADIPWFKNFPATCSLGGLLLVWGILHLLGRTALLDWDGSVKWRPANLPEPGEPPPGNRLAWPAPEDAAPRVATPAARALTVRKRHAPKDRGEGPVILIGAPALGFVVSVVVSLLLIAFDTGVIRVLWTIWGFVVWVCITTSIVLTTRRLNEDA
ncbi:MAG: hypothetical protein FD126_3315 [Elusimicrobia bacterium]|nr:MAG: hypothetical protein FD126_3315 [Elusimicrobiota bacterium]